MEQAGQNAAIAIKDLTFAYDPGARILDIDEFIVRRGEHLFLQGASGSGKSTLLALIAGVLPPNSGDIELLGNALAKTSPARRDRFRADHIGFIFQLFNLLPYLSVLDNVTLPCRFSELRRERALRERGALEEEAKRLLSHLGLSHDELLSRAVTKLSIGQQQRVAAARALIGGPEILIADEPTSSLDADARQDFIELLLAECALSESTLLFVSHDESLGPLFHRRLRIEDINRAEQS